uniref:Polygalacturonase n=1 Tax=Solanum lycopersicum TaxID=4081 RepID=A0A3Q7J3K5_SOLLC
MCSSISSYTMKNLVFLFILIGLSNSRIYSASIYGYPGSFNVLDYGAAADGITDDSQALLNTWNDACSSSAGYPQVSGSLVSPSSPSVWTGQDSSQWLAFRNVSGLVVGGSGTIDGQGKKWWDQSCRYHPELCLDQLVCTST